MEISFRRARSRRSAARAENEWIAVNNLLAPGFRGILDGRLAAINLTSHGGLLLPGGRLIKSRQIASLALEHRDRDYSGVVDTADAAHSNK
jgi:hypothetical protein